MVWGASQTVLSDLWQSHLQRCREEVIKEEAGRYSDESKNFAFEATISEDRFQLYKQCLEQISENCRQLLQLTFEKLKRKDIMERLGYASENSVNQRIHRCRGSLQKLITDVTH